LPDGEDREDVLQRIVTINDVLRSVCFELAMDSLTAAAAENAETEEAKVVPGSTVPVEGKEGNIRPPITHVQRQQLKHRVLTPLAAAAESKQRLGEFIDSLFAGLLRGDDLLLLFSLFVPAEQEGDDIIFSIRTFKVVLRPVCFELFNEFLAAACGPVPLVDGASVQPTAVSSLTRSDWLVQQQGDQGMIPTVNDPVRKVCFGCGCLVAFLNLFCCGADESSGGLASF